MGRCSVWRDLRIEMGCKEDYARVAGFHYCAGMPVAVVGVWVARVKTKDERQKTKGEIVGVLTLSRPVLNCAMRNIATGGRYVRGDKRAAARRLNRELCVISRVVVAPMFRGIGLGTELVRHALAHAPTPNVEAMATMGRYVHFFERAGMERWEMLGKPVYYLWKGDFCPSDASPKALSQPQRQRRTRVFAPKLRARPNKPELQFRFIKQRFAQQTGTVLPVCFGCTPKSPANRTRSVSEGHMCYRQRASPSLKLRVPFARPPTPNL